MRKPTVLTDLYQWLRQSLSGQDPQITSEPQCGFFRRRLVRGGPWVPCRIWLHQEIQEGELVAEERLRCEVDGKEACPIEQWTYLAARPVSEADYNYMVATSRWARKHAPEEAEANPGEKVDFLKLPLPF